MYRYCPHCATELELRSHDSRTLPTCPRCGFVHYNNSRPCVGVLVMEEGKILLVERAEEPFKGYWDIPGGFLDTGELPEAGAVRELREETGLDIEVTDLLGFFIDTYGADDVYTLNLCYLARVVGGVPYAGSDAVGLHWFPLDTLPEKIAFTWERKALQHFKEILRPRHHE